MEKVTVLPPEKLINGWIDPSYLPEGKDKYYIRNRQVRKPRGGWRHLTSDEIERLVKNDNTAASWDTIYVTDEFLPQMLKNNKFYGTVRIGRVSENGLQFHDLRLPCGISNSSIHSCDIGDDCAIHDVHYLSHYIIGDRCMLFNIHEMSTTDHSKFGNGTIKEGEKEAVRVRLEIMNETGCRAVYPFDGMITADAYLWAKYIDDAKLQEKLRTMTQKSVDSRRGYYGTVGDGCVIKTSEIIKDVKIGAGCYIKGASKLKNITINSSDQEPSQIGENVILVNGIVGYGCRIFYGCTAVKFVIGNNSNLKYGARMIDSVLGDNSTISCCEVLNNLIFPAHEQHHNNSFLIASCVKGQSNMAAGATVGSNHNSRTNDNEVVAGRGFWPGLCTSIKHSSVFASYTLLSKGAYPAELNIPLPFCMLANNEQKGELEIFPAFWWLRNMYALARNSWKYQHRDKRITKVQNIEFDTYAPDSMEEALQGRAILEVWTAKAWMRARGLDPEGVPEEELRTKGHLLLSGDPEVVDHLAVMGEGVEKSRRPVRIRKPREAWQAYGDMITHYAVMNALRYVESHPGTNLTDLGGQWAGERQSSWINLGGQLVAEADVDRLRADIRSGRLRNWAAIHARYAELWAQYPEDKMRHAYLCLCALLGREVLLADDWAQAIAREERIQQYICDQVYLTRKKDYENPFRRATYRSEAEMIAAVGELDDNGFVCQIQEETAANLGRLAVLRKHIK
jgi:NDP-sugar pyrophosphorylase family protein